MTDDREGYSPDEIARAWLVKLHGEDAAALRPEFEAWRDAAPENRQAWEQAHGQWQSAAALKQSARFGTGHTVTRRKMSWSMTKWPGAITTAIILAAGTGALVTTMPNASVSSARAAERFATARGEIKTFEIADGAAATLDTASRLDVLAGGGEQHIRVVSGRARIRSFGNGLPIRIEAGGATIVATNAEVDISIGPAGKLQILLLRGLARFEGNWARRVPAEIPVGKPLHFSVRGELQRGTRPDASLATDWPAGWAEYDSVSLGTLVGEANRYTARPIRIDDPAIARLELSGRFQVSETPRFARRIAELFDLELQQRSDGIHLSRKKISAGG
ncbi:MAG: DUF4880 domain-containing protein [Sphingopyxis sp.]|jgi:transmembrane sensor|uniref:FecR family protein n=1 Tax=Sphingopyxis sp. TaxID=1908224 RepID=UPI001A6379CD|nr:DUF4880 domain-containing protein [Sphingopyxis sp.]MBL9071870.1 DUF4880 domain-containing protein [Sphingopyxis sp.]